MTTPTCARCGSVRVLRNAGTRKMECQEPDCNEVAERRALGLTRRHAYPNQHWRDPAAMVPWGYDGE